jgi:HEAT repeat protein
MNRAVAMAIRRLNIPVLLILAVLTFAFMSGCQQGTLKQEDIASTGGAAPVTDSETQLKINLEALLRGATDEIRLDAAMVMLFNDNPRARQILIDTLEQAENKPAKIAVCRALVVSRETRRVIKDKKDFIVPLADVLKTEDAATAKFAAEAALLYEYDEIADVLEPMARDAALVAKARINVIYAMKMQLDVRAITRLAELIDDKDAQVAQAAEESLRSIGIPISRGASGRAQILSELRTRGMERFQRDWLVRQEGRVGVLEKERDLWRKLYLASLDKIYAGLSDDSQRGKMLAEQLASTETVVRLWALDKTAQWRIGSQSKLPAEIGPVLLKLISNENRDVRLASAKLLELTGEISSPERLAQQLGAEKDEEVRLELFVALGAACQYALVPTSGAQITPELRMQTLEWAAGYLNDDDAKKAHKGAEVMRKLLEPGGLSDEGADKYLNLLVERYKKTRQAGDANKSELRGDLLATMARLCGQSAYKAEVAKRFSGLFEEALNDQTDLVREAAVDGLICVDKPKALRILAKDFTNDKSQMVRARVLDLAGDVGGKDDLSWLWDKVGTNSESKAAWQAMLKIFNGCDVNIIEGWLPKFDYQQTATKLTDEQRVAFLEMAEKKASAENHPETVMAVREKLARLYVKAGQFEQAAEYLGKLREAAQTPEQKEAILGQLVDVYLRWPRLDSATRLINNCLLEKDLGPDDVLVRSIDAFWENPPAAADVNMVLDSLQKIKPVEMRPVWRQQVSRWAAAVEAMNGKAEPNRTAGQVN